MTTQQLYISWKTAVRARQWKKAKPLAEELDKRPDRNEVMSCAKCGCHEPKKGDV